MERVIVDMHPEDAYYATSKHDYIGQVIETHEGWKTWEVGNLRGWEVGDCTIGGLQDSLFAVKTVALVDYPGQEVTKSRITPYGNLYKRKLRLRTPRT